MSALRREGAVVIADANADLQRPLLQSILGYDPPMHVFAAEDGVPIQRTLHRTGAAHVGKDARSFPRIVRYTRFMTAVPAQARTERVELVARGIALEGLTIGWNVLAGALAIGAGIAARSNALTRLGADSVIEVVAAAALFVRLRADASGRGASRERAAMRVVAVAFFLLSAYVVAEAGWTLVAKRAPESSMAGVRVALVALVVMPLLARAKLGVGEVIGSAALVADAKCTLACAWLSARVLVAVGLNAALGRWWADPIAALVMVPFLVREGREGLEKARGKTSSCSCFGGCTE